MVVDCSGAEGGLVALEGPAADSGPLPEDGPVALAGLGGVGKNFLFILVLPWSVSFDEYSLLFFAKSLLALIPLDNYIPS